MKVRGTALTLALLLLHAIVLSGRTERGKAQDAAKSEKAAPAIDFGKELPRIKPQSPADSLESFKPAKGFKLELAATEPLIQDPIAIDFDENGRMFVVELQAYNQYANPKYEGGKRGVIRLLEDTDDDGRFDKSSPYVGGLTYPSAVACWDGGVFVGDAPDLLYCKDTDGDGRADVRKVIFTGFGTEQAGEAELNSFRWGFDNRFHISTGLYGGDVRAVSDEGSKPVSIRGMGLLFDPRDLSKFELASGGGQHGLGVDDWGRLFVCSNSVPAQTLMYDGRYVARNPYLQAPAAAVNIVKTGKFTELFRISPAEPWRVLRTRMRSKGQFRGSDEGGKPFGFFTGATGVTIYRGDAWPSKYRGNLIVGDVANNLVFRATLKPDGLSLVAERADQGAEFAATSDVWTRPVQFANAPDGSLYVVDMYRELIEGAAFLPPDMVAHLNVPGGMNLGRIYRIVPEGFQRRPRPKLGSASTGELVALLEHRNGWHRDTASRLLYQRQDRSAVAGLRKLAETSNFPQGRMHALYALDGLDALGEDDVQAALGDESQHVREQALRLSEQFAQQSPAIREKYRSMTNDADLRVRYQLAYTLGSITSAARNRMLAELMLKDGADKWIQLAVLSSLNSGSGDVFRLLIAQETFRKSGPGQAFLKTLATQIGAANRKNDIAAVLRSFDTLAADEKALRQSIVRSLVSKQKGAAKKQFSGAEGNAANAILAELLQDAKRIASDEKEQVAARADAVRTLGLAPFSELAAQFAELLELRQPQPVQAAALETLAGFNDPGVAKVLLGAWSGLSPQLRASATETFFSRTDSITAFLDAVEQGQIGRADVDPARVALLQSSANASIRKRAAKLFAGTGLARRKEVVAAYQKAFDFAGDVVRGKAAFKTVCSACHKLEDVGTAIGADLTAIRNAGTEAVLLNILDPNREVKPKFLNYSLVTTEGLIVSGMIVAESANSITIRRADETTATVLRVDIDELKSTGLSFMPEGLEKQVDVKMMADLLAYLNSLK